MRFEGMAESIGPMLVKPNPGGGTGRLPLVGPVTQAKERVGRTTLLSSSAMSSDRLFLDRVARQHCPSPLHRHPQITTHSSQAQAKGDISTLLGRGHFYFALTLHPVRLRSRRFMSYDVDLLQQHQGVLSGSLTELRR
jgi:hypothetical protein